MTLLQARSLSKAFRSSGSRGQRYAVREVSVSIETGSVVALVGESGSGKTTVMRLLTLLYKPTAGEILLDGETVKTQGAFSQLRRHTIYRSRVQLIFQDPYGALNPAKTVLYQLSRPLRTLRNTGNLGGDEHTRCIEVLERVGLRPGISFLDRFPHELSGGQRQRVVIARALIGGPSLVLADEPVSMLDVSMQADVLNLLSDLVAEDGLGMLYVTHNLATARYVANTIAVMYGGYIVEEGPTEEIVSGCGHPYTRVLLEATPDPERRWAGVVSSPERRPAELRAADDLGIRSRGGCPFVGACSRVQEQCGDMMPPWSDLGGGHRLRCWAPLE